MKIMILYTLNVERTLEAHVQTDFISRLRFFLHKIDPFFSLMTAKQVRVSLSRSISLGISVSTAKTAPCTV